jgi:hypothetical protein
MAPTLGGLLIGRNNDGSAFKFLGEQGGYGKPCKSFYSCRRELTNVYLRGFNPGGFALPNRSRDRPRYRALAVAGERRVTMAERW